MTNPRPKKPFDWEDYERGRSPRQGSTGSFGSHVQFDDVGTPPSASDRLAVPRNHDDDDETGDTLRHRRSSLSMRINALTHAGGPNSFENFARSWSRAAGFAEIPQPRPSFNISESGDESIGSKISGDTVTSAEPRSLLRQQLESAGTSPEVAVDEETNSSKANAGMQQAHNFAHSSSSPRGSSPFERAPHPSTSLMPPTYGSPYSSLPGKPSVSSLRRGRPFHGRDPSDLEHEPLLFKVVEQEDGTKLPVIIGRSTLPQTVFNSVNVLIGVGLLSLPLGLKQSGWLIGLVFLFCAALATRYTAGLLAKCMELDPTLVSFSDIAWKAFGTRVRIAVGVLFSIELMGACVALVVLFADSLDALIPGWGVIKWKVFCGLILIPLGFVPLRYLSFTSVLGIISCLGIVTLIFVDGFIKPHFPGSLRDPSTASLFPKRWSDLPLSFGLLMSPWGGHSVFPNIYRDMRHPQKYSRATNYTYIFTYLLDLSIAVAGYLMFGQQIRDEVTSNILLTPGYPRAASVCITVFIAIIPITKVPLNARPIFIIFEESLGLNVHNQPRFRLLSRSKYARNITHGLIRIFVIGTIVLVGILVPSFDTIMALLGSAMAFSICVILPVAFYLKLFSHEVAPAEKVFDYFLIGVCSVLAVIGTVWVFLPQHLRHRLDGDA